MCIPTYDQTARRIAPTSATFKSHPGASVGLRRVGKPFEAAVVFCVVAEGVVESPASVTPTLDPTMNMSIKLGKGVDGVGDGVELCYFPHHQPSDVGSERASATGNGVTECGGRVWWQSVVAQTVFGTD